MAWGCTRILTSLFPPHPQQPDPVSHFPSASDLLSPCASVPFPTSFFWLYPGEEGAAAWRGDKGALPYLEPVVPHSQVEDIIPLLLFAPFGQQLWGGERRGRKSLLSFPSSCGPETPSTL